MAQETKKESSDSYDSEEYESESGSGSSSGNGSSSRSDEKNSITDEDMKKPK